MKYIRIKAFPIKVETQYQGAYFGTVTLVNNVLHAWNHETWVDNDVASLLAQNGVPFEVLFEDRRKGDRRRG